jgi:hypothetical protein
MFCVVELKLLVVGVDNKVNLQAKLLFFWIFLKNHKIKSLLKFQVLQIGFFGKKKPQSDRHKKKPLVF